MCGDGSLPGTGNGLPWARLAELVRDRRRAARLTQRQLATAAGVSVGVVRDLEQGRTGQPRRRSVERISAALGVGLDPGGLPAGWPEGSDGEAAADQGAATPSGPWISTG